MTVTRLFGSTSQVVVSHRNITHTKRTEIAARLAQAMLRQASKRTRSRTCPTARPDAAARGARGAVPHWKPNPASHCCSWRWTDSN